MFKFLHAADLHLDSSLKGLERYSGAPAEEIRSATRGAVGNLVQLAIREKVRFVLIAGDVYDGDWSDFNTGLHFDEEMKRLREAEIRVFLIAGNHDAQNRMTRSLRLPENVSLFSAERAHSIEVDGLDVVVHGQSFGQREELRNLALMYPRAREGAFNIGLLHTAATGLEGHDTYAPCTVEELRDRGYQYWALGHIHKRQSLDAEQRVWFPGNLQGRHIRETGPKGCLLVSVDDRRRASVEFHALDVFRWERAVVDASLSASQDDLFQAVAEALAARCESAEGRPLAARVELSGATRLHDALARDLERLTNEIRAAARDVAPGRLWIEKVRLNTAPPRKEELTLDGPLAELTELLDDLLQDEDELISLIHSETELQQLASRLPAEWTDMPDAPRVADPLWLRGLLAHVRPVLASRLEKGGSA